MDYRFNMDQLTDWGTLPSEIITLTTSKGLPRPARNRR
jgi:hypothetical protein